MRQALEHLLRQTWQTRGWLSCVLWPLSWVMGALVALKQTLYRWGAFTPDRLPVPVIVVGNVMVGGVGKTPIVMALVEHLTRQGHDDGCFANAPHHDIAYHDDWHRQTIGNENAPTVEGLF